MEILSAVIRLSLAGSVMALPVLLLRPVVRKKLPGISMTLLWAAVFAVFVFPIWTQPLDAVRRLVGGAPVGQAFQNAAARLAGTAPETAQHATILAAPRKMLAAVWLSGAALMAGYFVFCRICLYRRFRNAVLLADDRYYQDLGDVWRQTLVYRSDRTETAVTYGFLHPKIVLPETLAGADDRTVRHVLLHESEHIRRMDSLSGALWLCLLCAEWFNPLIWFCRKLVREDMEYSCDAAVVGRLGQEGKADYARTILELTPVRGRYGAALTFGSASAGKRIRNVLDCRRATARSWCALAVLLCVLAAVFAPAAAAVETAGKASDTGTKKAGELAAELLQVSPDFVASEYGDGTGAYLLFRVTGTEKAYQLDLMGSYDVKNSGWLSSGVLMPDVYRRFQLTRSAQTSTLGSYSVRILAAQGFSLFGTDGEYLILVRDGLYSDGAVYRTLRQGGLAFLTGSAAVCQLSGGGWSIEAR